MGAYLALAGLQIVGGFQSADIIRKNGDLQANIANMNAQYAELDAYKATEAGYGNAARYQSTIDQTIAADRGAYASEGVQVGYGTAAAVQGDNRIAGMVNTLQIQKNARDQAAGYQAQAINIQLGAQTIQLQAGLNADSTQSQALLGATSTLLAGYGMNQSTGKGKDSSSGTNGQSWKNKTVSMVANPSGDGVSVPSGMTGVGASAEPQWYPDPGKGGTPGFYGYGPRSDFGSTALGGYSFTSETGG